MRMDKPLNAQGLFKVITHPGHVGMFCNYILYAFLPDDFADAGNVKWIQVSLSFFTEKRYHGIRFRKT